MKVQRRLTWINIAQTVTDATHNVSKKLGTYRLQQKACGHRLRTYSGDQMGSIKFQTTRTKLFAFKINFSLYNCLNIFVLCESVFIQILYMSAFCKKLLKFCIISTTFQCFPLFHSKLF